jgi:hypothetical protein
MNLLIESKDAPPNFEEGLTYIRIIDKDSAAHMNLSFRNGDPTVQHLFTKDASLDQTIEMLKAVKEYRNEA